MALSFWILIGLIVYAYFGYPLLLSFISKFKRERIEKKDIYPNVSIIIAAHNEEKSIKDKIENTISLDYPKEKLEIIVASDSSTDRTNEIVSNCKDDRVKLLNFTKRKGKTFVQNEAVKEANGEIMLFSDATTTYDSQVIKKMVQNFADSNVGAVGGELVFININENAIGGGGGLYWKYEKFLKRKESQITSLIGVSGCCYAVRKDLYEPIGLDVISDFVIAQIVYKKGKKVVYEPGAVSFEETNDNVKDEFKMRVRIAVRTLYGLWYMRSLFNPLKYGFFAVQLISHKILRYLVPVILILLFLVNVILQINNPLWLYKLILYLQIAFYVGAFLGRVFQKRKIFIYLPFYFCLTNFALLIGIVKFLRGEKQVLWDPLRK